MESKANKLSLLDKIQKYTSPTEIAKEFNTRITNFKKNFSAIVAETRKYTLWERSSSAGMTYLRSVRYLDGCI